MVHDEWTLRPQTGAFIDSLAIYPGIYSLAKRILLYT